MDGTSIQPVMPVGGEGGFGLNGIGGIFALLILLGIFNGGNGIFGNNRNYEQYATSSEVQRGFDTQNLNSQTSAILSAVNNGTAQAVAATNASFHDSLAAMQSLYNETARDIAGLSVGQANTLAQINECCCSTKQQIMQNDYNGAMRDAATNANFTAQIQGLKDMINQNTIQGLRDQVDSLRDQVNMSGVLRFPQSWSYGAGPFPPIFGGCGCNGNI